MPIVEMSTRGRLTLPIAVRRQLGLKPGMRLQVVHADDGTVVLRKAPRVKKREAAEQSMAEEAQEGM